MRKISRYKLTALSILRYPIICNKIKKIKSNIFLIFPSYETGGSEQVHYDIMQTIKNLHPTCFITNIPNNNDMKEKFQSVSNVIDLLRWGWKESYKKIMLKNVAKQINQTKNAVVFGSNNRFYYDLLPYLDDNVKKIDLVHTFMADSDPECFENYSLRIIDRIDYRIVLGYWHAEKLKTFYQKKQRTKVPETIVIHNKVEINERIIEKENKEIYTALFVGRNSEEKRVDLFIKITEACEKEGLPIKFTMIGDFEEYEDNSKRNLEVRKRIKEKNELNRYYQKSDFILITSIYEGFPMVFLEGMSYGCIPMSTAVGEIPYHINPENKTGFIFSNDLSEEQLIKEFVNALKICLNDTILQREISKNVQTLVKEKFNPDLFADKYHKILTSV